MVKRGETVKKPTFEVVNYGETFTNDGESGENAGDTSPFAKYEEDFTNPSIEIDSKNTEQAIQDLTAGVGSDAPFYIKSAQYRTVAKAINTYLSKVHNPKEKASLNGFQTNVLDNFNTLCHTVQNDMGIDFYEKYWSKSDTFNTFQKKINAALEVLKK